MDDGELAALSDENYFEAFRLLCEAAGIPAMEFDGVLCTASGLPVAFMNVAFIRRPLGQAKEALRQATRHFDELGVPFVVRVREGTDEAAESTLASLGMPYSDTVPGMALWPFEVQPKAVEGLEIRTVSTDGELSDFQEAMAAGFGMPIEMTRQLVGERTLEAPGLDCFVGYADGKPVATSTLVCTGQTAGVYNVATIEGQRGRGYGEALTAHAALDGAARGCEVSVLQASEMGRPIYERMGYRLVAPYHTFHRR